VTRPWLQITFTSPNAKKIFNKFSNSEVGKVTEDIYLKIWPIFFWKSIYLFQITWLNMFNYWQNVKPPGAFKQGSIWYLVVNNNITLSPHYPVISEKCSCQNVNKVISNMATEQNNNTCSIIHTQTHIHTQV